MKINTNVAISRMIHDFPDKRAHKFERLVNEYRKNDNDTKIPEYRENDSSNAYVL